jgi:transcriptional regulator NrdR family protein
MDTGCTCRACTYKRTNIIRKLNNGEQNTEKIIHEVVKAEYLQNVKIPNFNKKIQKINRVLVQLKNRVPKRKISKNLMNHF